VTTTNSTGSTSLFVHNSEARDDPLRVGPDPERKSPNHRLLYIVSHHGLVILAVVFVIAYAIILPDTFLSTQTLRAILGASIIVSFLALAEMIVIASNNFDLSVAYSLGLMHIITMGLLVKFGVPWPVVVLIVIGAGALVGLINGLLVEYAKIDSFIATLGVGTILYGLGAWYTNGSQLIGDLPVQFTNINDLAFFGVPLPALFVAILVVVLWIGFEYLPIGRQIYAIGGNRKAAELTGIPARRLVIGAFVVGGAIVGLAGRLCGMLTIRCSSKSGAKIASKMLGVDVDKAVSEIWDALGEICNMVAGNFKNKISGLGDGCMLSVPTVITGGDYRCHSLGNSTTLQINFLFDGDGVIATLEIHN